MKTAEEIIGQYHDPKETMAYISVEAAILAMHEFATQSRWVPCADRLPEPGKRVMFVVKCGDENYNGLVMGGMMSADGVTFTTPGCGWGASFWQPSPEPPNQ